MTAAPSIETKIAAVAIVLALGGLAGYTLFSGPTVVQVNTGAAGGGTTVTVPQGEPDDGGGGLGD